MSRRKSVSLEDARQKQDEVARVCSGEPRCRPLGCEGGRRAAERAFEWLVCHPYLRFTGFAPRRRLGGWRYRAWLRMHALECTKSRKVTDESEYRCLLHLHSSMSEVAKEQVREELELWSEERTSCLWKRGTSLPARSQRTKREDKGRMRRCSPREERRKSRDHTDLRAPLVG